MAAITRDTSFKPVAPTHVYSYVDVEDDANEIPAGAFVQRTATGRAVMLGDTGGLGIGPVLGVNERNVPDQLGKTYSGPLERPVSKAYVGLFERPIATANPVTDADMFKPVYAANNHDVTSDSTKPLLGVMVGINNDAGTCTLLLGAQTLGLTGGSGSTGYLPVSLGAATLTDGTPLAQWVDGVGATPGLDVAGGEYPNVRWNPNATPAAIAAAVPLPADLDPAQDVIVLMLAAKEAAGGDTPSITVGAFVQQVGTAYDADVDAGGASGAMTDAAKTVQLVTRTIAAADIPALTPGAPGILSLTIAPTAGTLPTDDVLLGAVMVAYTRR